MQSNGAVPRRYPSEAANSSRGGHQQHPHNGNVRDYSAGPQRSHPNQERGARHQGGGGARPPFQHHPLNFGTLKRLAEDSTETSEIVKRFTEEDYGLKKLLQQEKTKNDILELVLVVIGKFCKKNGVSSFSNAFTKMMYILAEEVHINKMSYDCKKKIIIIKKF